LANNPRLVKEATALQSAGYAVTVVFGRSVPGLDGADATLVRAHGLTARPVDYTRRRGTLAAEALHRFARWRARLVRKPSFDVAARAHHRAARALAEAASSTPAELYIGHTPAGLAAAGLAARMHRSLLGFDAEDFHSGETKELLARPSAQRTLASIEHALLPNCVHFTAASPLIAEAYASGYGMRKPVTVLNVFPLAMAPERPIAEPRTPGTPPRLYWFSQTIGPGRGLETFPQILGRMRTTCDLFLRGSPVPGYLDRLRQQAAAAGYRGAIELLPRAAPDEMARLAAGYDLGLALEESTPPNRDLCLTNKLFLYLLAGVPIVYSPTRAQCLFARDVGAAALEADLARPDETARTLDDYFSDPARRSAARTEAWTLARSRYHWDCEKCTLLSSVEAALATRRGRPIPA